MTKFDILWEMYSLPDTPTSHPMRTYRVGDVVVTIGSLVKVEWVDECYLQGHRTVGGTLNMDGIRLRYSTHLLPFCLLSQI